MKDSLIEGQSRLQFRVVSNVPNHTNFANPNGRLSDAVKRDGAGGKLWQDRHLTDPRILEER